MSYKFIKSSLHKHLPQTTLIIKTSSYHIKITCDRCVCCCWFWKWDEKITWIIINNSTGASSMLLWSIMLLFFVHLLWTERYVINKVVCLAQQYQLDVSQVFFWYEIIWTFHCVLLVLTLLFNLKYLKYIKCNTGNIWQTKSLN